MGRLYKHNSGLKINTCVYIYIYILHPPLRYLLFFPVLCAFGYTCSSSGLQRMLHQDFASEPLPPTFNCVCCVMVVPVFVCIYIYMYCCPFVRLRVCLLVCLPIHPSIHLFIRLSYDLAIYLSVCLAISSSDPVYACVYLCICIYIYIYRYIDLHIYIYIHKRTHTDLSLSLFFLREPFAGHLSFSFSL